MELGPLQRKWMEELRGGDLRVLENSALRWAGAALASLKSSFWVRSAETAAALQTKTANVLACAGV